MQRVQAADLLWKDRDRGQEQECRTETARGGEYSSMKNQEDWSAEQGRELGPTN